MAKTPRKPTRDDPQGREFGRFVFRLRKGRALTQEQLAERAGLAADTIRRHESNEFSPSLHTLTKLAIGLRLDLSSLFLAYDLRELEVDSELLAKARTLGPTNSRRHCACSRSWPICSVP